MHMQLNTVFSTFQVKLYYLKKFFMFFRRAFVGNWSLLFCKKNRLTVYVILYFGLPVIGK